MITKASKNFFFSCNKKKKTKQNEQNFPGKLRPLLTAPLAGLQKRHHASDNLGRRGGLGRRRRGGRSKAKG